MTAVDSSDIPVCRCGHSAYLHAGTPDRGCWSGAWVQKPIVDCLPNVLWEACTCSTFEPMRQSADVRT